MNFTFLPRPSNQVYLYIPYNNAKKKNKNKNKATPSNNLKHITHVKMELKNIFSGKRACLVVEQSLEHESSA